MTIDAGSLANRIAVYGASGFTGGLAVAELRLPGAAMAPLHVRVRRVRRVRTAVRTEVAELFAQLGAPGVVESIPEVLDEEARKAARRRDLERRTALIREGGTAYRAVSGVQRSVMSGRFSMLRSPSLVSRTVKPWRS